MSNRFYMNRFLVVPSLMMSSLMMIALPAKTEPLSWKASPTTTGGTLFNSKEEAVSDFQSKGGQYAAMSEELPGEIVNDTKVIKYKIPDAQLIVSDWEYDAQGFDTDRFPTVGGALNAYKEEFLQVLTDNPYLTLCKSMVINTGSGSWNGSSDTYYPRIFGMTGNETRDYTFTYAQYHVNDGPLHCHDMDGLIKVIRYRRFSCPTHTSFNLDQGMCINAERSTVTGYPLYFVAPKPNICHVKSAPLEGNPCNPATGNKIQSETDYTSANGALSVQRYYTSQGVGDGFSDLGPRWRHNYAQRFDGYSEPDYLAEQGNKSQLYNTPRQACLDGWNSIKGTIYNGLLSDGRAYYRNGACEIRQGISYVAKFVIHNTLHGGKDAGTHIKIHNITSSNGTSISFRYLSGQWQSLRPTQSNLAQTDTGWTFTKDNGTIESFDSDGKLIISTDRNGQTTQFSYDSEGRIHVVTGHFGNTLTYSYNDIGLLTTITTPTGDLGYGYDAEGRLISITYPDNRTRQYHYEDSRFPNHLTGITDENGDRYATWAYDAVGRAILSEHAGNAERVEFAYNPDGTTTVTDAAGAERIYHFTVQQGQMKVDHIEGDRCTTCSGGDNQAYTYDNNGFIASKTDWNGNTTTYSRDSQGRELSRTEASGTPQARTITTTWDTTLNKPLTVTDPEQIT
ncbi:MAG: DUF6531 domain-containing protein, partial [Candidatus Thiodiazotropha lotti]|nr:DUF6531 domain-containing protein [Candidatus Thiodiazotropha lotti]